MWVAFSGFPFWFDRFLIILPVSTLQDQNESAAILKIKESMQEEAKRFEKDGEMIDNSNYYQ